MVESTKRTIVFLFQCALMPIVFVACCIADFSAWEGWKKWKRRSRLYLE